MLAATIREEAIARRDRGLSLRDVAGAIGLSPSMASRIETGRVPDVGVIRLSTMASVVGLDLSVRTFPGGSPLRDAGHTDLLKRFKAHVSPRLGWAIEVGLPATGDPRAWDAVVRGREWRYGVEAETHPTDGQALARRLALKCRDDDVGGVILVLPRTRHARAFLAAAGDLLSPSFPVAGRRALECLTAGIDPGGSAIVIV